MKTKTILTALAPILALTMTASFAARASTCQDMKLNKKAPIAFRAFPLENPATGEKYAPNEEIEVGEGKKMQAMAFFSQLNDTEQKLNAWGYSLRDGGAVNLQELDICIALLSSQTDLIQKDLDKNPPKPWDLAARAQELEDKFNAYKENLVGLDQLWQKADDEAVKVYLPPPPTFTAPVPEPARAKPKDVMKTRAWSFETGDKKKFWIGGKATISLQGSRELTATDADGAFSSALLGLWEGEVAGAHARAEAGKNKPPKLAVQVRLLGNTVWNPTYTTKGDNPLDLLHQEDKFARGVDHSVAWRFAIGPVPMAARFGVMGEGGFRYGYDVALTAVGAQAGPYASAHAYAQVGIDIGIGGGGIQGRLLIIEDALTLNADASVSFVDEPEITLDLGANNSIEALSGDISAYAWVNYLFGVWRGNYVIWKWTGFKETQNLFHFKYVWTPTGARAEGDVRQEDVLEVNAANLEMRLVEGENLSKKKLFDVMKATSEDLASPLTAQVKIQQARTASVNEGTERNVNAYLEELKKWLGT